MTDLALTPASSAAAATNIIKAEVRNLTVERDIQGLLTAVSTDLELAPELDIDSDDMASEMLEMLGRLSTVSSAIEAERMDRGKPLRDTLQWLSDGYNPAKVKVDSVIAIGKGKLNAYNNEKRAAAAKLAAEQAEARRAAAAQAAVAEAAALAAANAAAVEAAALRAAGSEQVAQAMETQAMVAVDTARQAASVAAHAIHAGPVRATGGGSVKGSGEVWKGECINKADLILHIAERIAAGDKSLMNLVEIDQKAVNALAKLQKEHLNVRGLRSYPEGRISIRKQAVDPATA